MNEKQIGEITNYYGGLHVQEKNGKYYWAIEGCYGLDDSNYDEIPKYLYDALIKYETEREKAPIEKDDALEISPNVYIIENNYEFYKGIETSKDELIKWEKIPQELYDELKQKHDEAIAKIIKQAEKENAEIDAMNYAIRNSKKLGYVFPEKHIEKYQKFYGIEK